MLASHSHPIAQYDDLLIIVVPASHVGLRWAMDNYWTLVVVMLVRQELSRGWAAYEYPICHSVAHVRVIPVRPILTGDGKPIGKRGFCRNRALRNPGNTIGPIGTVLMKAVCEDIIWTK